MIGTVWTSGINTYKIFSNSLWLLVFQHNTSYGKFDQSTAKFNLKKGKFSYLSIISNPKLIRRFSESYEFILEYPVEFPNQYNHWIQSKDPIYDSSTETNSYEASGFRPINLSWPDNFGGLTNNHLNYSLLDGQKSDSRWNYAIGDWYDRYIDTEGKTPGPVFGDYLIYDTVHVTSIYLWIRIRSQINYLCTKIRMLSLNNSSILLFIFFLQK